MQMKHWNQITISRDQEKRKWDTSMEMLQIAIEVSENIPRFKEYLGFSESSIKASSSKFSLWFTTDLFKDFTSSLPSLTNQYDDHSLCCCSCTFSCCC